jgi:hypothetical protein
VVQESDPQQAIEDLACEARGVPNVGYLQAGDERERI